MQKIAIVAFEGMSLFHLSVPIAVFSDAQLDSEAFSVQVCAEQLGNLMTSDGLNIAIEHGFDVIADADMLIFPSWDIARQPSDKLMALTRQLVVDTKLVVGLCLGAYALAYCGVLAGKTATTHWRYGQDFMARFPDVLLDSDPLYVAQDNIITSAGTAAAIDCCLYITKQICGVSNANEVARLMVSAPLRSGGQNQYIKHPVPKAGSDKRIGALVAEVLSDLSQCWSLTLAAQRCAMSERSFTRHFSAQYGVSFTRWLTNMRLNYSLELLETGKHGIQHTSDMAGFSSEQNFRKLFKQTFGITPQHWKRQFAVN